MVLIGLLLVALVCLALGLVLASAGWLVASLAVTAVAGYVLWTKRHEIGARPGPPAAAGAHPDQDPDEPGAVDADYQKRRAAWFAEGTAEGHVWVIDGRPDYHGAGCGLLVGQSAEPVPYAQAVEDGFTPCTACDPHAAVVGPAPVPPRDVPPRDVPPRDVPARPADSRAAAATPTATGDGAALDTMVHAPAVAAALPEQVWVVDGRPRYHRADCMIIKGQDAEPIPVGQATEDGFMPCSLCEPDAVSR